MLVTLKKLILFYMSIRVNRTAITLYGMDFEVKLVHCWRLVSLAIILSVKASTSFTSATKSLNFLKGTRIFRQTEPLPKESSTCIKYGGFLSKCYQG